MRHRSKRWQYTKLYVAWPRKAMSLNDISTLLLIADWRNPLSKIAATDDSTALTKRRPTV